MLSADFFLSSMLSVKIKWFGITYFVSKYSSIIHSVLKYKCYHPYRIKVHVHVLYTLALGFTIPYFEFRNKLVQANTHWDVTLNFILLSCSLVALLVACLVGFIPTHKRNEPYIIQCTFGDMRPAKIQLSLRIRAVWTESSLGAVWITKHAKFLHTDKEDSGLTVKMCRLIWVCVSRTCTFSHVAAIMIFIELLILTTCCMFTAMTSSIQILVILKRGSEKSRQQFYNVKVTTTQNMIIISFCVHNIITFSVDSDCSRNAKCITIIALLS